MAHTDRQTHGHGDSMTDPAQRAESVKIAWGGDKQTDKQKDGHHNSMTESAQWADSVKCSAVVFPALCE